MKACLLIGGLSVFVTSSAALAQEGNPHALKLSLSGWYESYLVAATQSDSLGQPGYARRGIDMKRRGVINFNGETRLDPGMVVGFNVGLRAENTPDDPFETGYLYLSDTWGKIEGGNNYGAPTQIMVAAPTVTTFDINDPDFNIADHGANLAPDGYVTLYSTYPLLATKVSYFTPEIGGFQAGVSYAPDNWAGGSMTMAPDNDVDDFGDILEMAAIYTWETEGDMEFAASGAYAAASLEASGPLYDDDEKSWSLGFSAENAPWTFGGGYTWDNNAIKTGGDSRAWSLGIQYDAEDWRASFTVFRSAMETGAGNPDDTYNRLVAGWATDIGPGIEANASLQRHELDGGAPDRCNTANVATIGLFLNF